MNHDEEDPRPSTSSGRTVMQKGGFNELWVRVCASGSESETESEPEIIRGVCTRCRKDTCQHAMKKRRL